MNNKLSADPAAMVLAIIGLVIVLLGCCCGLFAIVSLVLGIVALVLANKSLREYVLEPENYTVGSYKNVKTARILGIVGIILSALILIAQATFFAVNGQRFSREFLEKFEKNGEFQYHIGTDDDAQDGDSNDDWDEEGTIRLKKQGDSIYIDTVTAETNQKI